MSGDPRKYICWQLYWYCLAARMLAACAIPCTGGSQKRIPAFPSRGRRWGWGRLRRAQTPKADARAAMSLLMFTCDRVLAGLKEVETCLEC